MLKKVTGNLPCNKIKSVFSLLIVGIHLLDE